MQPIERYGVIALLLLVVIIAAVVMWDQGEKSLAVAKAEPTVAALDGLNRESVSKQAQPAKPRRKEPAFQSQSWTPGAANTAKAEQRRKQDEAALLLEDLARAQADLREVPEVKVERKPMAKQPNKLAGALIQPVVKPAIRKRPAAAKEQTRSYTIQAGDTLGQIAVDQLGSYRHLAALQQANPSIEPAHLVVGTQLTLPNIVGASPVPQKQAAPRAKTPTATGPRYTIAPGDSLWAIAARELGDGNRYKEIAAMNPAINPDVLVVGTALVLPSGARTERVSAAVSRQTVAAVTPKRGVVR